MVKICRNDTPKARAAIAALNRAKALNGDYNLPEVNAALSEMFHKKCYICENKEGITSFQIEHLRSHKGKVALKYNWNNLFLSCAHCNNIKSTQYEPILDCTQTDIDLHIAFRKVGYFGTTETFEFVALDESEETKNTIELLRSVYYGTTPQKKMEAMNIRQALRKSLSLFKNLIRTYDEAEDYDKEDLKCEICRQVKPSAEFAAFKRWLLWDNREKYYELIQYCHLPTR